jgi:hypothetical protein
MNEPTQHQFGVASWCNLIGVHCRRSAPPNRRMKQASAARLKRNLVIVNLALIRARSPIGVARERVGSQVMR